MTPHDDTLVIDVRRHNPAAFSRLQHEAAKLPLTPGWRSSHQAYLTTGGLGWHWNHNPPPPPPDTTPAPPLPPPPGGTSGRRSVSHFLYVDPYRAWDYVWKLIKEIVQLPSLELTRVYLNAYPYGCDTGVHRDSQNPDEVTIVLAVHEDWNVDYGGETAVLDDRDEVVRAVLPIPGRAFVFRSNLRHAARPVARSCAIVRRMAVFKCAVWPVDMPIRSRAPDDLGQTVNALEPFAHAGHLKGRQRLAAAATWLSRSPAANWPHGRTNFAAHLTTTALYLEALGAPRTTVLAGLAHAVFGTQHYRRRLLDPVRDRALAEAVFGRKATKLALRFASIDRKALGAWGERIKAGVAMPTDGVRIPRHANPPDPGEDIHLPDTDALEQLLLIESANLLTMTPDPTENALPDNVNAVTGQAPRGSDRTRQKY